jgi:TetR/AcrR family transcriptional regulator, cholesterol catabolism regulator
MKARNRISTLLDENDRVANIYLTAAEVICEKGFDATSLNDIAKAVGLTKAGLYHYISGKEALLFAIMDYANDLTKNEVMAPASEVEDAEQRLRTIINSHTRLITEKGQAVTILVDEMAGLTPTHSRKVIQGQRAYFEFIRDTLNQLNTEGKLREVDTTVATFCLLGSLLWLSRWYRPDGRLTSQQLAGQITQIALGGLLRNSESRSRG